MLDHLTLHVKDIDRSITFYKQALAPLGYIVKAHHEPTLGFGVDDGTCTPISTCHRLKAGAEASPVTPVTHIAFLADSQQAVQAFHAAALAAGGRDNGAPGPRPYHPGYYSAFVLDPDGNNIEAVVDWLIRTSKNISVSCLRRHRRRRLQPVGFVVATAV